MENTPKEKRKIPGFFIAGLVFFAVLTGYFAWQNTVLTGKLEECSKGAIAESQAATAKNDSMLTELTALSQRYDTMSTMYAGLDSLFKSEKERIVKLEQELKKYQSGGGGGQSYEKIQKEYVLLKARQDDYLKQIELLKDENRALTLENINIKSDLMVEQDKNAALNAKITNLNTKIQSGSLLYVTFIKADAVQVKNGNEVSVNKAKKTEKLRCCFTVGKNTLAAQGYKDFYLRVIDPSGEVLKNDGTLGSSGEIKLKDGTIFTYTTKASVLYENESVETCIYTFGKTKNYTKGNYKFEIYYDNQNVASTSITLN